MQLLGLRLLALGTLVGLYVFSPFIGVTALAAGLGYGIWRRRASVRQNAGRMTSEKSAA